MEESSRPRPWAIHFFQREPVDGQTGRVPAADFLDGLSTEMVAEVLAILDAVAAGPPPSFSGGGKWEVMHGAMAGIFEVRARSGRTNHRVFCLLERRGGRGGGPTIVLLGGLSKPRRQPARGRDYRTVLADREEYRRTGRVLE